MFLRGDRNSVLRLLLLPPTSISVVVYASESRSVVKLFSELLALTSLLVTVNYSKQEICSIFIITLTVRVRVRVGKKSFFVERGFRGCLYEKICPGSIPIKRGPRFAGIPSPQQISAKKSLCSYEKKMSRQNGISALIS